MEINIPILAGIIYYNHHYHNDNPILGIINLSNKTPNKPGYIKVYPFMEGSFFMDIHNINYMTKFIIKRLKEINKYGSINLKLDDIIIVKKIYINRKDLERQDY